MACISPIYVENVKEYDVIPVPCGKCVECRKRKVDEWVFRLMEEDKVSSSSHFVTLTYDTLSIPITKNGFMTLDKSDFQRFMKRLRKQTGFENIRYYAAGEYGEKNRRPHYHAIIFNVPTQASYFNAWSLVKEKWMQYYAPVLPNGQLYDPYPKLSNEDKIQLGQLHIGQVSGKSIAYTAKYLDKIQRKKKHSREDWAREFSLMSKGLGESYLTDEIIKYHQERPEQLYLTMAGGKKIAMPKYYRNKIWPVGQLDMERDLQLEAVAEAMRKKKKEERAEAIRKGIHPVEYWYGKVRAKKNRFNKYNSKNRRL
jgi:hypothetical protein